MTKIFSIFHWKIMFFCDDKITLNHFVQLFVKHFVQLFVKHFVKHFVKLFWQAFCQPIRPWILATEPDWLPGRLAGWLLLAAGWLALAGWLAGLLARWLADWANKLKH